MAAFGPPFSTSGFGGFGLSNGFSSTSSFPGFPGFPSSTPSFSYPSIPTAAPSYTTASPSSALLSGKYPSTTPGYTQARAPPQPPMMKKAKRVRRRVVDEDSISDPGPDYDYGDYFEPNHVPSEEGINEIPQTPEPQPARRGQAAGVPPVWGTENGKSASRKQYSPRQYTSPVQDQAQFNPFSATSARSLPTSASRGSVTPSSRGTFLTETSYAKENIGMEGDHPRDISSRLKDQKFKVASAAFSSKSNRWGALYPKIDGHAARTERHRIARQHGMSPTTTVTEWEEQQRRAMEDEERKYHAAQTGVFEAWQPRDPFSDPTQPTMVF